MLMILCWAALGALPTQQAFAQALRYGSQAGNDNDDFTINSDNSWNYSKLRLQTGPYIAWNIRSFNEELFFQFDNTSDHASDGRVALKLTPKGDLFTQGIINGSNSLYIRGDNTVIGIDNPTERIRLGFVLQYGKQPTLASSAGNPIIFSQSSGSLNQSDIYYSTFTERMRVAANGNVGIGTPAPSQKLEVNGNIKTTGMLVGTITTPLENTALQVRGSMHVDNSAGDQVFHVSSGKQLVFVGKDAYTRYLATQSAATGKIQSNNFSLWVSKGIVTEDIAFADVASWSDYVFKKDFKLRPLSEVNTYIQKEGHLPGMPSEEEVKQNGYKVHDMLTRMLAKIEELTLYSIKQQEEIERLKTRLESEKNLRKNFGRQHSSNQR